MHYFIYFSKSKDKDQINCISSSITEVHMSCCSYTIVLLFSEHEGTCVPTDRRPFHGELSTQGSLQPEDSPYYLSLALWRGWVATAAMCLTFCSEDDDGGESRERESVRCHSTQGTVSTDTPPQSTWVPVAWHPWRGFVSISYLRCGEFILIISLSSVSVSVFNFYFHKCILYYRVLR